MGDLHLLLDIVVHKDLGDSWRRCETLDRDSDQRDQRTSLHRIARRRFVKQHRERSRVERHPLHGLRS